MLAHFEIVPAFTNSRTDVCVDGSCASDRFWLCVFRVGSDLAARKAAFPVWSTSRVMSATVLALRVDGSASPDCRIFRGPVRMVRKPGAMPDQSTPGIGRQIVPWMGWAEPLPRVLIRPSRIVHGPEPSLDGVPSAEPPREVPRVRFYTSAGNETPLVEFRRWAVGRMTGCIISRHYFAGQVASLLKFAKETTNPQLAAVLIEKAADLKSQVDESSTTPEPSTQAPAVQPERQVPGP